MLPTQGRTLLPPVPWNIQNPVCFAVPENPNLIIHNDNIISICYNDSMQPPHIINLGDFPHDRLGQCETIHHPSVQRVKYINLQTFLHSRLTQTIDITPVCKLYSKWLVDSRLCIIRKPMRFNPSPSMQEVCFWLNFEDWGTLAKGEEGTPCSLGRRSLLCHHIRRI